MRRKVHHVVSTCLMENILQPGYWLSFICISVTSENSGMCKSAFTSCGGNATVFGQNPMQPCSQVYDVLPGTSTDMQYSTDLSQNRVEVNTNQKWYLSRSMINRYSVHKQSHA